MIDVQATVFIDDAADDAAADAILQAIQAMPHVRVLEVARWEVE